MVNNHLQTSPLAMDNAKRQRSAKNRFRKRRNGLFKKTFELSKLCEAEVFLVIEKDDKFYTFRSTEDESWPPTMEEIVSSYHDYLPSA
jgi:hypothetical protein